MNGMQNKTIKKVLDKKIEDWLNSIEDRELARKIRKDVIVTGGSITSLIMGDKVNDYDIYFTNKEITYEVAKYYVEQFKKLNPNCDPVPEAKLINEERVVIWVQGSGVISEEGKDPVEETDDVFENDPEEHQELEEDKNKPKYRPVFLSENAITLSNKIQIIIRFYGEPEKIHENFDYVHARCWYKPYTNVLETPVDALRSMQSKTLIYKGSLFPICSLFRMRKFISRGWRISAGEILKMSLQISDLDLKDPRVLKEQLTGVDALYFNMLIRAIENKQLEQYGSPYVIEVIDRIFSNK